MSETTEVVKKSGRKPLPPGPGRPKGVPNKFTAALKDAIITAAERAGGKDGLVGYLTRQADENPAPFMSLLGKVLPMQVTGADGDAMKHQHTVIITGVKRSTD